MNVKQNIGIVNALVRITVGLTVLAWSTAKLTRMPWRDSYIVMALLAAMKVGEGIVRFCPIVALFEREQNMRNNQQPTSNTHPNPSENSLTDPFLPYSTQ